MALAQFNLSGRFAVVTGAAGLLGTQHTMALLEAGAQVIVTDQHAVAAEAAVAALPSDLQRCSTALAMDVTAVESVEAALDQVLSRFGRVDILINNAAVDPRVTTQGVGTRLEQLEIAEWNQQIAVGLTGAFLCSRAFGGHMAASGGGVILNIASDLSVIAPDQRLYRVNGVPDEEQPVKPVTYSVIKTGLIGLTRYLATYWAAQGVRVNALSPGGVYTGQPEHFVERLTSRIPLGRMAESDEYRGAIQFLCSDAAKYMTGQNVVIDGGRSVW
jgi:NAD(P)-dependent dehydrogenase (short-subunit alcohol dehydrogenase family)